MKKREYGDWLEGHYNNDEYNNDEPVDSVESESSLWILIPLIEILVIAGIVIFLFAKWP